MTMGKKVILKDKKVLVVGIARSGTGAANLLSSLGAEVCITDIKPRHFLEEHIHQLLPSVRVIAGGHPAEIFTRADLIILSPGVSPDIPPLINARARGIPIIGELELAYQIVTSSPVKDRKALDYGAGELPALPAGRRVARKKQNTKTNTEIKKQYVERAGNFTYATPQFVGVTGTNGKSTTVTLIDMMLKRARFNTILGGNIGNPLTKIIYGAQSAGTDYIVAEVSSFQLETIQEFKPFISVILNITHDHLDRYRSMQLYIDAKARIFKNQGVGDCLILNADDPILMELYRSHFQSNSTYGSGNVRVVFFSRKREVEGIYYKDGNLHLNLLSTLRTAPSFCFRKKAEGGGCLLPFQDYSG